MYHGVYTMYVTLSHGNGSVQRDCVHVYAPHRSMRRCASYGVLQNTDTGTLHLLQGVWNFGLTTLGVLGSTGPLIAHVGASNVVQYAKVWNFNSLGELNSVDMLDYGGVFATGFTNAPIQWAPWLPVEAAGIHHVQFDGAGDVADANSLNGPAARMY